MTAAGSGGRDQGPVVPGPGPRAVGSTLPAPQPTGPSPPTPADLVEQPAKLIRIGSMVRQLLDEARSAPLDEAARDRLRAIHAASIRELEDGLAPELRDELDRLAPPFDEKPSPSAAELRVAQAQLVGWLEGVFHGIQMALFLQQTSARVQLEGLRVGALPQPPVEIPQREGTYL